MNAYKLANRLQEIYKQDLKANCWDDSIQCATTMLRQQADRIAELEKQTKPLSDEEIEGIANANVDGYSSMEQLKWFARAILRKARD